MTDTPTPDAVAAIARAIREAERQENQTGRSPAETVLYVLSNAGYTLARTGWPPLRALARMWREQAHRIESELLTSVDEDDRRALRLATVRAEHAATLLTAAKQLEDVLDGNPTALAALEEEVGA